MRRVPWCESTTAQAPPRLRVERFCGKSRYRVHVLGEFRAIKVHYRFGENTVPCATPDPCAYCADPQLWKTRWEHCAAALLRDDKDNLFVPIVAIFTQGAFNKLQRGPAGPHRGRLLDVWRVHQGMSKVLEVKETGRVEPPYPAFDLEPHLLRMWFPHDTTIPAGEVPAPIAFVPDPAGQRPAAPAEVFRMSDEARALLRNHVARIKAEQAAEGDEIRLESITVRPDLVEGRNAEAGPRILVQPAITPAAEEEALEKRSGQSVCGDFRGAMARIKAKREQEAAAAAAQAPPPAVGDAVFDVLTAATAGANGKHPAKKGGAR